MSLLLSAIGATVAAVLDVTLGRYLTIGDATPHLLLVLGVIWSIAAGLERGIAWAFVGGLVADALLSHPLGATPFALLIAVGGARLVAQPFTRLRVLAPIVAVPIFSIVFSVLIFVLASNGQSAIGDPVGLFLPAAIYDGVLGIALGPLIVSTHDRQVAVERLEW
jgi:rod shape-determining protein MreD